jgi:hypothetical protein
MFDDAMRDTQIYPDKALGCAAVRYPRLKPLRVLTVRTGNATCRHRPPAITGFGRQNP